MFYIANFKQNLNKFQIQSWMFQFAKLYKTSSNNNVLVACSNNYFYMFEALKGVKSCGQDVSIYQNGSHTGLVGAFQLKDFCDYCIVGHSETKSLVSEVFEKIKNCFEYNITPIICFKNQAELTEYLLFLQNHSFKNQVLFAWEDPENISNSQGLKTLDINAISVSLTNFRQLISQDQILLYGGSITKQNCFDIANTKLINGFLIGKSSLDPVQFTDIIYSTSYIYEK